MLRFDLGRRGVQALRELQRDPAITADANAPQVIAAALARTSRWDDGHRLDKGPQDVAALQRALKLAKGSSSPPDDWWQALATRAIDGESCAQSERDCLIVHRDLDGDGTGEVLLCELYTHRGPDCVLYARGRDAQWYRAGSLFGTVSGQASIESGGTLGLDANSVLVGTTDLSIVQAILDMGRSLGLDVLAEGVETQAQHDMLLGAGCKRFQGYLFCHPVPVDQLPNVRPHPRHSPELTT